MNTNWLLVHYLESEPNTCRPDGVTTGQNTHDKGPTRTLPLAGLMGGTITGNLGRDAVELGDKKIETEIHSRKSPFFPDTKILIFLIRNYYSL